MNNRRLLAGIAAGALLLAGCGGSATPSASPASAVASSSASQKPAASASAASSASPAGSASVAGSTSAKPAARPSAPTSRAPASGSAAASPSGSAAAKPAPSFPPITPGKLTLTKPLPALSPPVTVKARVGNSLTTAPFWYAIEKGYFDQLGLKFEEVNITESTDIVGPLTQGQIDVAGTAFSSGLYNAATRGTNVEAVSDNGKMAPNLAGAAAVVKKGQAASYGKDWCALKGKKVAGGAPGSGLYATLIKALASCNLTLKDVDNTNIGFGLQNQAVQNGAVDVAFQVEPFVSAGVQQGILDIWHPLDQAFPNQQMNFLMYSPEFAKNQAAGLRFMVAYLAGARDYSRAISGKGDKTEMGVIMAKHLAIKNPKAYDNMIMMAVDPNGAIDLANLNAEIKIFQDAGVVQPGAITTNWINDNFRKQALDYLGPFTP